MLTFTIETLSPKPAPKYRKSFRPKYPFEKMAVGTGFIIPADQDGLFHHARVAASLYNSANGTFIRCSKLTDGTMQVWRDADRSNGNGTAANGISQKQFNEYLDSLSAGQSFAINTQYIAMLPLFKQWTADYANISETMTKAEEVEGTLRITKGIKVNIRRT